MMWSIYLRLPLLHFFFFYHTYIYKKYLFPKVWLCIFYDFLCMSQSLKHFSMHPALDFVWKPRTNGSKSPIQEPRGSAAGTPGTPGTWKTWKWMNSHGNNLLVYDIYIYIHDIYIYMIYIYIYKHTHVLYYTIFILSHIISWESPWWNKDQKLWSNAPVIMATHKHTHKA